MLSLIADSCIFCAYIFVNPYDYLLCRARKLKKKWSRLSYVEICVNLLLPNWVWIVRANGIQSQIVTASGRVLDDDQSTSVFFNPRIVRRPHQLHHRCLKRLLFTRQFIVHPRILIHVQQLNNMFTDTDGEIKNGMRLVYSMCKIEIEIISIEIHILKKSLLIEDSVNWRDHSYGYCS